MKCNIFSGTKLNAFEKSGSVDYLTLCVRTTKIGAHSGCQEWYSEWNLREKSYFQQRKPVSIIKSALFDRWILLVGSNFPVESLCIGAYGFMWPNDVSTGLHRKCLKNQHYALNNLVNTLQLCHQISTRMRLTDICWKILKLFALVNDLVITSTES